MTITLINKAKKGKCGFPPGLLGYPCISTTLDPLRFRTSSIALINQIWNLHSLYQLSNMNASAKYEIDRFFEKFSPISQDVCDDEAANIAGGGIIKPTSMQGAQSYTVQVASDAKSLIVQFRDPKSPIDLDLMTTARETYGRLVPDCQYLKERPGPLLVYTMNYISG